MAGVNVVLTISQNVHLSSILLSSIEKKVILENGKSSIAREICSDFTLNVETEAGNIINMKNTSGIKIL